MKDMMDRLSEQTMRLTELETEYEHYRTKTQTEIIEVRDKYETVQAKLDSQPNYEQLVA